MILAAPAAAPPPIPMRIDGRAFDSADVPLPAGAPIRAFIDGVVYSNASTVHDALGSFAVHVLGNNMIGNAPETPEVKEGADLGEEVMFAAGELTSSVDVFREVLAWFPGATRMQDLHLAAPAANPSPVKIQGLVPLPAAGGDPFAFVCNPTSAAVDLASYYIEVNRPGIVRGPRIALNGTLLPNDEVRVDLPPSFLIPTGDAVKLVFANPGGAGAPAAGADIVVDRVEYNATSGGSLTWEPGNTILGDAPAPRPGHILERSPACDDTNEPSDFRIAPEPGLPPNGPPTVAFLEPSAGNVLAAGQPTTIRWAMSDDVFHPAYLRVWVNATYGGAAVAILDGVDGATSVPWTVPDIEARDVRITIEVEDPFAERASAAGGPFTVTRTPPLGGLAIFIAVLVVLVILAFLLIAFLSARRRRDGAYTPVPPPVPGAAPPAVPPPPAMQAAPAAGTKRCPRCGTIVYERDWTCFFCGHRFEGPPGTPPQGPA